jgi:hypothetical protein
MDLMTHWLDDSTAGSDSRASSAYQRASKSQSKKKGDSGATAKKSAKAGKKADAKAGSKAGTEKKKLDVKHAALVRDSFTIPGDELQLLADAKKKCLKAGIDIKKSELIRIGISLVYGLGLSRLKKEKRALQPIKTGRPKKAKLV